jgi:FrmR/RcnR family transcriptional regulator, repressor of frmRAB operon
MAHTTRDKGKLLKRVARIRGQVEAIESALDEGKECSSVLQLIASCRGAINGLMAEVVEGHVRCHVLSPGVKSESGQGRAAEELIELINSYLK